MKPMTQDGALSCTKIGSMRFDVRSIVKVFIVMPRFAIATMVLLFAVVSARSVQAQETPTDLLVQAWQEYGLQAFYNADALFARIADVSKGETRWQALFGQAQITHYQMPGRDPAAAIPLYEALLAEIALSEAGDAGPWRGLILARLADCHAELQPQQIDRARSLYREALAETPPNSPMVQETTLRLLATYLQIPDRAEISRGLQVADEFAAQMADSPFASVFHGLRAEMAFFVADYPALAAALDAQYQAGISNIKVKELVLFRLARLHEVELGDYERAEAYYRTLVREVPSSKKAHFAGLRADELRASKLDSDYAPPLSKRSAADGQ
jgi:hypothetical protein